MIAFLGMYDRPETRAANDRLWASIRDHLGRGPQHLSRQVDVWQTWASPDLIFAQTCGMPYRTRLHDTVNLVGTPDYRLPGCAPGHYNSVFVVGRDAPGDQLADFAGKTLAYNEPMSQSGWAAPMTHAMAMGTRFGKTLETGAHVASARAVADGRADIAGLDGLSWLLMQRYDDFTDRLRVLTQTTPTPGLPFITALSRDPAPIADAVRKAIAGLAPADRDTLHLYDLVQIPAADYLAIPTPPGP